MAAKSYTKEDLKKLMQERKQEQLLEKRIDSPLARYDNAGNLFCRVCELKIENANFWTKHLVSKEHKLVSSFLESSLDSLLESLLELITNRETASFAVPGTNQEEPQPAVN